MVCFHPSNRICHTHWEDHCFYRWWWRSFFISGSSGMWPPFLPTCRYGPCLCYNCQMHQLEPHDLLQWTAHCHVSACPHLLPCRVPFVPILHLLLCHHVEDAQILVHCSAHLQWLVFCSFAHDRLLLIFFLCFQNSWPARCLLCLQLATHAPLSQWPGSEIGLAIVLISIRNFDVRLSRRLAPNQTSYLF